MANWRGQGSCRRLMPVVSSLFMKMKIQAVGAQGKSKSYSEGVTETGRLAVSMRFGLYELVNNVSLISSNSARLCKRYGHVSLKSLEVECEACGPACGGMPDS